LAIASIVVASGLGAADAGAQFQAAETALNTSLSVAATTAKAKKKKPDFPAFDKVSDGLTEVVSTINGKKGWYTLHSDDTTGRLLATLPKNYKDRLMMISLTVAGGDEQAGVMGPTWYAYWKPLGKDRLMLMQPNFIIRSHGDQQSKNSIKQLYTDTVLLVAPIVSKNNGAPVIDLQKLLLNDLSKVKSPFNGGFGPTIRGFNPKLATLTEAKSFPRNFEIAYEAPDRAGRLVTLHWSFLDFPENKKFKPRQADDRVGFFNVYYDEMGDLGSDEPYHRYITRWDIEKADPKLNMSPPKNPLVWYIESTTPIRYRRYVREGILSWNKAFEKVGIYNAIEVYQQDAVTGAHMDKDPEDARFNFFRWNTSNQGYAIGPSRWDPRTGQIVDADVVWHAGLLNAVINAFYKNVTIPAAMQGFTPETIAWLDEHPQWDPRVRLAPPAVRDRMLSQRRAAIDHRAPAAPPDAGAAAFSVNSEAQYLDQYKNVQCQIGEYVAMNIALYSAVVDSGMANDADDGDRIDGVPEAFMGPMVRYLTAHEVGHTLGLQHNFGASTIRTLDEINNSAGEPYIASVMEYCAANVVPPGQTQGPFATTGIGPYDEWAIAFGYGDPKNRDEILAGVSDPDHIFLSPYAMIGPDPRAQVWDLGADPLDFAERQIALVESLRSSLVEKLVKDGQPWSRARQRYNALLGTHVQSLAIAARWVGGSYTHWDRKGDPGDRSPIEDVPADTQRRALKLVMDHAFKDGAFGLTPDMIRKFGLQYWPDDPGFGAVLQDPSYNIHDTIAGVQAAAMTMIMNPTTLRRVYDNEFRTADEANPITLSEVFNEVVDEVWSELDEPSRGSYSAIKPKISSFRRNLQREHLERLIDLTLLRDAASPSARTIANLSRLTLSQVNAKLKKMADRGGLDDYTLAHCMDCSRRIEKALDGVYIYKD